ncbi:hypothetical protein D9F39_24565 [Escherichia coli]|nr:hypothetical protein [Escherichia coli]
MDAALDEITMPTEIVAAIGEGALAYRESGILSLADGRVFSACRSAWWRRWRRLFSGWLPAKDT